jgi:N-acetylglucosaminyldiphosphoundecaprenol N-acetyl-beta-D-mannosaminyltransferase
MNAETRRETAKVLGIPVEPLDMESAVARIAEELEQHRTGYVCMVCVHGVMEALRVPAFAQGYARAAVTVPDGEPTVWVGRSQGFRRMRRVAGPDLMLEIFRRSQFAHRTHFLYGGKEGVAEELRESLLRRFPWVRIFGAVTPPFHNLTLGEEELLAAQINNLKPDMIWIGLGTPKQDRFMMRLLPLLDSGLMFGVGAAFDFHTGRIMDSPLWIKRAGMQWLHRLIQDPRRLLSRYLRDNPAFVFHALLQLTGLRTYPQMVIDKALSVRPQAATDQ